MTRCGCNASMLHVAFDKQATGLVCIQRFGSRSAVGCNGRGILTSPLLENPILATAAKQILVQSCIASKSQLSCVSVVRVIR
jgi:hypothetical protein